MPDSENLYLRRTSTFMRQGAEVLLRTRRRRWITGSVLTFLVIFTIAGFFLVPHILRGVLTGRVATSLHRPVSVGRVRFNPYTLRLQIDRMQVGDHSEPNPLAAFEHLDVRVSWLTLFRLAPIVHEVTLVKPAINIVRQADGNFNFSDLIAPPVPAPAPTPSSGPPKFAVSNIRIVDGDIAFDDRKTGEHHAIEDLDLNVPFIANLPSKLDVVVEPLLQLRIDGREVRIAGASKPFAGSLDSALTLDFHRIDLPRYTGYLPPSLAIKLPSGALSIDALLHFRQSGTGPVIEINGAVAIDQFDLRDTSNAPVLAIDHGEVKMVDVEPLDRVISLSEIEIVGLKVNAVRNKDGTLNFSTLTGPPPPAAQAAAPAAVSNPAPSAAPSAAPTSGEAQLDFGVEAIKVMNSSVSVADLTGATPANDALENISANVNNLHLHGQLPAQFDLNGTLHSGGTIAIKGTVDIPKSEAAADVAVDQVDLPGLQAFAQSAFAGTIASGKFTLRTTLKSQFAGDKFNVHVEPAELAIDNLAIQQPRVKEPPIAWNHLGVSLADFDLASRQIDVKEVRLDALKAYVRRGKRGALSLQKLIKTAEAPPTPRGKRVAKPAPKERNPNPAPPEAPWNYHVDSVAIEKTDLRFEDDSTPRVVRAQFSPLNIHVKNVSSDFSKPMDLQVDGVRNRRGSFKIDGNATIKPVKANLKIETRNLDMAAANEYVSTKLNAQVTRAELTMKADVGVEQVRSDYRIKYGGDLTLGNLTAIDKLTGDDFVDWKALSVKGGEVVIGDGVPKVRVREISLADFDARLILNSSGKLNLSDLVAAPNEAPTSLTRTEEQQPAPAPAAAPSPVPAAPAAQPMNADILIDKVTLEGGHIDYSDDFIKPHYSANLTDIAGSIGTFGTSTQQPAEVDLQGAVNGSAPLNISGSVNPLAPLAAVDIKASAKGIELTGLSAYSTKYTGYPIVKGDLTLDVHYTLNQGQLTANNHIFIDQLTFGDRVENSSAANLPVRFAVAVLKNSRGEIDLNIPASGSLSDPQFSISSVIWAAFRNVLVKAVTAPFSLLAAAVQGIAGGGGGGAAGTASNNADLSFVAFDPGYATLTPDEKKELTTLGVALQDHPDLKLSICGRVDPELDMKGLREAWVTDQIRAVKIKDTGGAEDSEGVEVTKADFDKYLERAYSKAKIPKPRNFIGLAKDIPPEEMKKLMIENAPVTKDDLPKLANERATAVRLYLRGSVPAARMTVIPPKLNADGITQGATTRVDLSLQ